MKELVFKNIYPLLRSVVVCFRASVIHPTDRISKTVSIASEMLAICLYDLAQKEPIELRAKIVVFQIEIETGGTNL